MIPFTFSMNPFKTISNSDFNKDLSIQIYEIQTREVTLAKKFSRATSTILFNIFCVNKYLYIKQ